MKMIGVCAERLYWRISFAVSRPSMSGMVTSRRITANPRCRISFSASDPERTITRFWSSSSRIVRKTSSFSGRSSTIRMLVLSMQPPSQDGEQVLAIDRLRQVVPRSGGDALLAVALHRLGGDGDDRQLAAARQLLDLL